MLESVSAQDRRPINASVNTGTGFFSFSATAPIWALAYYYC
jgi:hypothetical protein